LLEIWLRKHADEYGLTGKDGNPNQLGIEEICKVANWKPSGGATPTPVAVHDLSAKQSTSAGKARLKPPTRQATPPTPLAQEASGPIDDDIPF
jgi:hypothetical protein